ncbi:hypothetical protein NXS97_17405 [Pantoea sp. B623]|uniref:hypothetical protein n=1 Tax=Pantoea sp. B623 TaxID=2974561 RepID=UPI002167E004|nr:hypothetical protein [Pantoea sp. B623]MCS4495937.1 hypothetical protein [Pantoea sp. B623]
MELSEAYMIFSARHFIELPYVMNLKDGFYDFLYDGVTIRIGVNNNFYALTTMINSVQFTSAIETKENLIPHLKETDSLIKTRTILSFYTAYEITQLLEPTREEVIDFIRSSTFTGDDDYPSKEDGEKAFERLNEEALEKIRETISIKKTAETAFPASQAMSCIDVVNHFIRVYSIHFNDLFTEEVSLYQVASGLTNGVLVQLLCDNQTISLIPVAGLIPPLFRSPLFIHDETQTNEFRNILFQEDAVNKSSLLLMRAKHLKTKSMFRSATLEASASIESFIRIKLEKAMSKKSFSPDDIKRRLSSTKGFEDRCKKLFSEFYSKSVPEIAPLEWQNVKKDRDTIRHKTAHASYEPSENEVSIMITNIENLTTKVNAFIDKNENTK